MARKRIKTGSLCCVMIVVFFIFMFITIIFPSRSQEYDQMITFSAYYVLLGPLIFGIGAWLIRIYNQKVDQENSAEFSLYQQQPPRYSNQPVNPPQIPISNDLEYKDKLGSTQDTYLKPRSLSPTSLKPSSIEDVKICEHCGARNPTDAHFCPSCGAVQR